MWRRIALRSALIAGFAAALTSLPATATLNPAPATTVRMAKIGVPGKPLRAFDISWVDSASGHYYLADRSNGAIDVVDIATKQIVKHFKVGLEPEGVLLNHDGGPRFRSGTGWHGPCWIDGGTQADSLINGRALGVVICAARSDPQASFRWTFHLRGWHANN